jgi:preprotein translocase subunit SecG
MLYYLIVTLYVLTCGLLIITILLQQGKGGDIASAFGGGTSQAVFGARSGATLLTRATSVLAALFVILALSLVIIGQRGPSSVVGGVEGPPPASPVVPTPANATPTPAPATPPPGNSTP